MVLAQRALGLKVGAVGMEDGSVVGMVGRAVGTKVGPVEMKITITSSGNTSFGIPHLLK